jgi:hypothetical protein
MRDRRFLVLHLPQLAADRIRARVDAARFPIILDANTRTISPHPPGTVPALIAAGRGARRAPFPGVLCRDHPQPAHVAGLRPRRGGPG